METVDLRFGYGDVEILRGVNFRAEKGEVTILMGRNGAGKTTLLKHLNGLLKPHSGYVLVDSEKVRYDRKSLIELRRKVVYVFQNPDDQIVAPTVWQDVAFGPVNLGIEGAELKKLVSKSLETVGLEGYEKRLCSTLSGGEKKRLAVASALAMNPDYVIMDEPTAGVDGFGLKAMIEIIEMLRNEGKGIVVSTHDVDLAKAVGDRFSFMDSGRIVWEGDRLNYSLAIKLGIRTYAFGKLFVLPHSLFQEVPDVDFVGVMGGKAREVVEREGIEPDITSVVLERCILRAVEGHSVLLVCSDEMVNVVLREAEKFPVQIELMGAEVEDLRKSKNECDLSVHSLGTGCESWSPRSPRSLK